MKMPKPTPPSFRSRPASGPPPSMRGIGAPAGFGAPSRPPAAQPRAPKMMADGGMGAPPPPGGMGGPDDQDMGAPSGAVPSPESLHYHDTPEQCQTCKFMGQDGMCAILQISVSPEGGCNAHSGNDQDQDQDQDLGEPGPDGDTDMDMGGGGQ